MQWVAIPVGIETWHSSAQGELQSRAIRHSFELAQQVLEEQIWEVVSLGAAVFPKLEWISHFCIISMLSLFYVKKWL